MAKHAETAHIEPAGEAAGGTRGWEAREPVEDQLRIVHPSTEGEVCTVESCQVSAQQPELFRTIPRTRHRGHRLVFRIPLVEDLANRREQRTGRRRAARRP